MKEDERIRSNFSKYWSPNVVASEKGRQVKLEIMQSEKMFNSVAVSAVDAIICADGKGNIVFWNPGARHGNG